MQSCKHPLALVNGRLYCRSSKYSGALGAVVINAKGRIEEVNTNEGSGFSRFNGLAEEVIDANGAAIVPGLIDAHVHAQPYFNYFGIHPDDVFFEQGVTTVCDAGTVNHAGVPDFINMVIKKSKTEILFWLNVSILGLMSYKDGECTARQMLDPSAAIAIVEKLRCGRLAGVDEEFNDVVGIKVRNGFEQVGSDSLEPTRLAVQAARVLELPVMLHQTHGPHIDLCLGTLGETDWLTHCCHGRDVSHNATILAADGSSIRPSVLEAQKRGLVLDLGHGAGSFSWDVADRTIGNGWRPTTLSSEKHALCPERVGMLDVCTKMLSLRVLFEEVICLCTNAPAERLGRQSEIGTLAVGSRADIAVLREAGGAFELVDTHENSRTAEKKVECLLTVRNGEVVHKRMQ